MRPSCGKTVEIRWKCSADMHNKRIFRYRIDESPFAFTEEMFEPVKDMSNTTIQEYLDKLCESFSSTKGSIICGGLDNEAVKKVMAYQIPKKPILNDSEKKYLESALRPFKDRIGYIAIINWADGKACCLRLRARIDPEESTRSTNSMSFPPFDEGTMYKGMEIEKHYTPEDLGLWEEEI